MAWRWWSRKTQTPMMKWCMSTMAIQFQAPAATVIMVPHRTAQQLAMETMEATIMEHLQQSIIS